MADVETVVTVPGLAQFRRDLRAISADLPKEFRKDLVEAGQIVVEASRGLTPRRSGRLAAATRATTSGDKLIIRNPLPYANVIHWGGTTGPGHQRGPGKGAVRVKGSYFGSRAIDEKADLVLDRIGEGIVNLAGRHGWH